MTFYPYRHIGLLHHETLAYRLYKVFVETLFVTAYNAIY